MKYAVTFCAMDQEVGANAGWHACILISKHDEKTGKLQVVDQWSFYGSPSAASLDSWSRKAKRNFGLDIDFTGNFGWFKHEELRFLDQGKGLHGATFELSEEKFDALNQRCQDFYQGQLDAVAQWTQDLKPQEKFRNMPYEYVAGPLYQLERERAKQQGCSPRLLPFELMPSFSLLSGVSLSEAKTCKSQMVTMLEGILSDQQIDRLQGNERNSYKMRVLASLSQCLSKERMTEIKNALAHKTIPRNLSGPMERICLHSSGSHKEHIKRSGEKVCFREWQEGDSALYWTVLPQEVEMLDGQKDYSGSLPKTVVDEVKRSARYLQQTEWLLMNANFTEQHQPQKEKLLTLIRDHYHIFALFTRSETAPQSSWHHSFLSSLGLSSDDGEQALQKTLIDCRQLFNRITWCINEALDVDSKDDNDLVESMVSKLSDKEKQTLCQTLGRTYCPLTEDEKAATAAMA